MGRPSRNLTGESHGRLFVVGLSNHVKDRRYWWCLCSCGNSKEIVTANIANGHTKSCGCLREEAKKASIAFMAAAHQKAPGVSGFNTFINGYRRSAEIRGLEFSISNDLFRELTLRNCSYCNAVPHTERRANSVRATYIGNGIDRVDNTIGYTIDNCVSCCPTCNYMKRELSTKDFIEHIVAIARNNNGC
jgi:hypothetical protein